MRIQPAIAFPLIAVLLGVAAWRVVTHARYKPTAEPVPVRCEACGHEFVPKRGDQDPVCPACGRPARIRLIYYRCKSCGATFVAYEADPARDVVRVPGGEWMSRSACDLLPSCPECGSDETYFVKTPDQPPKKPDGGT